MDLPPAWSGLRWVQHYTPEIEKRWKRYGRLVGGSWRMDETYVFETADIVIRGIELAEKIKKRQVKVGKLSGRRAMPQEIWQAVLAA